MVTIAKDGDLLLAVGDGGSTTLLVSSATLAASSKYFAALISPRFREGQHSRTSETPQRISLEDDNAQAMEDMCALLHGHEMVVLYEGAPSERLLHLAAVVDKYDCVERLRPHPSTMLFNFLDQEAGREDHMNTYLDQLLAASYLFDNVRCFRIVSKRQMMETSESEGTWPEDISRDILPERILDAVDHKRLIATTNASYKLPDVLLNFCPEDSEDCRSQAKEEYSDFFGKEGERERMTLRQMFGKAKETTTWLACRHMLGYDGASKFEELDHLLQELERDVAGMCLPCARAGNGLKKPCSVGSHK